MTTMTMMADRQDSFSGLDALSASGADGAWSGDWQAGSVPAANEDWEPPLRRPGLAIFDDEPA